LDSLLEAHREVQAYGRKLALFSERAPIAVLETDARGTILEMNPAAENLFGWAASEMLGRNVVTMLLGGDDVARTEQWWRDFIAAGKPETLVVDEVLRRDGLALACEWTLTPLLDEDGKVSTIVLHGRDMTQQRASERVRSEFTSTLSHELRTPLTSILGSLQLLRSGVMGDVPKDQDELVEIAEKNSKRLLDLINEVLDIEKIESGRMSLTPEPVQLDELRREALTLNQGFADRFSVKLRLEGEPPRVMVRADRKRLMQVVTMQGWIGCEDRQGGGTTFFFELPVLAAAERDAAGPVRVLVTEQDTVAAEYLAMVLEKAGYRVDHVPNAQDSKVLLERWHYGCWLLNTRLPDAGDSLALLDELQPELRDT